MGVVTKEYQTLVLDDIKVNAGLSHPVRASLLERALVRKVPLRSLHPNPDDEFCNPEIGPNYEIVSDYERQYREGRMSRWDSIAQRLSVEKCSTGGYMLLDGHHRWLAANRARQTSMPVEVLNVTPIETIISSVTQSSRHMCASFDLDEVLLTDGKRCPADRLVPLYLRLMLGLKMRKNSPSLIRELNKLGFDVWVYSGRYYSEFLLNLLFRYYRVKINGMVNGFRNKEARAKLQKAFRDNYRYSLHIENNSIVCVNSSDKTYEIVDLQHTDAMWAADVLAAVKKLDCVKAMNG